MADIDNHLPIGALVHENATLPDEQLQVFVQYLQEQGKLVLGVVQAPDEVSFAYRSKMGIINLSNGEYTSIAQDLGEHNTSCCLDSEAVSNASHILAEARALKPDLIIVNRFGKLEAEGEGFADEMLEIMSESIPMLTVVTPQFLESWRTFSGGLGSEINPELAELKAWFDNTNNR